LRRSIFLFKQFPFGALVAIVALVAGLFSVVRAFQAMQELARSREREAQIAAVYAEIRELRHELYYSQVSPKDLLIELDRTEEQLQNGHSSVDQTRIKLQSLRNELAESQQRSNVGELSILKVVQQKSGDGPKPPKNPRGSGLEMGHP
jgi:hypothetical protein